MRIARLLRVQRTVRVLAVLVIVVSVLALAAFALFPRRASQYTAGLPPAQFYRTLEPHRLDDYEGVFGVAHNSAPDLDQAIGRARDSPVAASRLRRGELRAC